MKDVNDMTSKELLEEAARLKGYVKFKHFDDDIWAERITDPEYPSCECFEQVPTPDWTGEQLMEEMRQAEAEIHVYHPVGINGFVAYYDPNSMTAYFGETVTLAVRRAYVAWKRSIETGCQLA